MSNKTKLDNSYIIQKRIDIDDLVRYLDDKCSNVECIKCPKYTTLDINNIFGNKFNYMIRFKYNGIECSYGINLNKCSVMVEVIGDKGIELLQEYCEVV